MEKDYYTVGEYLLKRLEDVGIKHVFGVPGDFVLKFFDQLVESTLEVVNTCNELNAGYAADGYARMNGMGALAVTYGAGALSAVNAIAGAFAEHIPVILISGSPDTEFHKSEPLWHHTLGDYKIPKQIYDPITVSSKIIMDPEVAPEQIDELINNCLCQSRPVYLELPMDVAVSRCKAPTDWLERTGTVSNDAALLEATHSALGILAKARKPVILVGMEVDRFGLKKEVLDLIEKTGYPFSAMTLGKAVLSENHPQFIGMYQGIMTPGYIKQRVENADGILCIGTLMTDANLGGFSAKLNEDKLIQATNSKVKVKNRIYENVFLKEFLGKLISEVSSGNSDEYDINNAGFSYYDRGSREYEPAPKKKLTVDRLYQRMAHFIKEGDVILAEVGTSLFATSQMIMPEGAKFIGQSFYGSIGYTLPATLGVCKAAPERRVILFIGDGSFQLTCQELSSIIREELSPIIFLMNNSGYTMERLIDDGPYNDIQPWKNYALPAIFNGTPGVEVHTEDDLETALQMVDNGSRLLFIEVHLDKWDCSESLRGMIAAAE